jgi:hypothetical protein
MNIKKITFSKVINKIKVFLINRRSKGKFLSEKGSFNLDDDFKINDDELIPRSNLIDGITYSLMHTIDYKNIPKEVFQVIDKNWNKIEKALGGEAILRSAYMYRNLHVPLEDQSTEIFSEAWHRDTIGVPNVQLFTLLNNTTIEDGPLRYVDSNNMLKAEKKYPKLGDWNTRDKKNEISNDLVNYFTGPRGSYLLLSTITHFHSAIIPHKGHFRDMVSIAFEPESITSWERSKTLNRQQVKEFLYDKINVEK